MATEVDVQTRLKQLEEQLQDVASFVQEKRKEEQEIKEREERLAKEQHNSRLNKYMFALNYLRRFGCSVGDLRNTFEMGRIVGVLSQFGVPELERSLLHPDNASKKLDDFIEEYQAQLIP